MRSVAFVVLYLLFISTSATEDKENHDYIQDEVNKRQYDLRIEPYYAGKNEKHPCQDFKCPAGSECIIGEHFLPLCACIQYCPFQTDPKFKVCSNMNETWNSECELSRMRCLCDRRSYECRYRRYEHLQLDYLGECKAFKSCLPYEMKDFPLRMAYWFANAMKKLDELHKLSENHIQMKHRVEIQLINNEYPSIAIIWKFCDLDVHPYDRFISKYELSILTVTIVQHEHCTLPFLNTCDMNKDDRLSFEEWSSCLGLRTDQIQYRCF